MRNTTKFESNYFVFDVTDIVIQTQTSDAIPGSTIELDVRIIYNTNRVQFKFGEHLL